jgi:hypothetical protein
MWLAWAGDERYDRAEMDGWKSLSYVLLKGIILMAKMDML